MGFFVSHAHVSWNFEALVVSTKNSKRLFTVFSVDAPSTFSIKLTKLISTPYFSQNLKNLDKRVHSIDAGTLKLPWFGNKDAPVAFSSA